MTFLPRTVMNDWALAFLSPEMLTSTKLWRGRIGECASMYSRTAAVAIVTMF